MKTQAITGKNLSQDFGLTRKQANFVAELLNDKKLSATEAVRRTYGDRGKQISDKTAAVIATENLAKPNIMQALSHFGLEAELTVAGVMTNARKHRNSVQWQTLAERTAENILDRLHGKPTQRTESLSAKLITISLGNLKEKKD